MKLIIDIPEDRYNEIVKDDYIPDGNFRRNCIQAIKSSIPFDNIKTEIEHVADYTYGSTNYDTDLYNGAYKDGLYEAIDIIDKYIQKEV